MRLIIEENPLLQENYEDVLNSLLTKLGGFRYRPFKFETLGYPHLWPGDAITRLVDAEGSVTTSIITNHTYKLNGNSTLEAKGETEAVRGVCYGCTVYTVTEASVAGRPRRLRRPGRRRL